MLAASLTPVKAAASHKDIIQTGQVLPSRRRGSTTDPLVLERDHLFAAPGGDVTAVQQPRLAGAGCSCGHSDSDRRRHRRGGSQDRRGWRRRYRHVRHGRREVELADAARYEVFKVQ